MREKQLAQEAKKLDAKVGGTKGWGLEESSRRIGRGWRENARDGKLEPRDHPEGPRLVQRDGERGFGRGVPGSDGSGLLCAITGILRLHLGAETSPTVDW